MDESSWSISLCWMVQTKCTLAIRVIGWAKSMSGNSCVLLCTTVLKARFKGQDLLKTDFWNFIRAIQYSDVDNQF